MEHPIIDEMPVRVSAKEFALSQLAPYFADPSTCGYDGINCCYLTGDGKMCIAGKNMLNPSDYSNDCSIYSILYGKDESTILKPEACGILTPHQWFHLQHAHDKIANRDNEDTIKAALDSLALFTYEELQEAAKEYQS